MSVDPLIELLLVSSLNETNVFIIDLQIWKVGIIQYKLSGLRFHKSTIKNKIYFI